MVDIAHRGAGAHADDPTVQMASGGARTPGRTRVELCGTLLVEIDGNDVTARLPGRQGRALFAYLALNRLRPVPRDELIAAIWPDTPPESPRACLSVLLTRLRAGIGPDAVLGRDPVSMPLAGARIDVELVHDSVRDGEAALADGAWQEAAAAVQAGLELGEGPLLPGIDAPWAEDERRALDLARERLEEVSVRAALGLGGPRLAEAQARVRRLIDRNPFRESGYALLMEVQRSRGNVAEALMTFDELREVLREVGATPSPPVRELHTRLLQQDRPAAAPLASRAPAGAVPLPDPLEPRVERPFVGREPELRRLTGRWRRATQGGWQLVRIAGEAGIGKTSLAGCLARRAHAEGANVLYGRCEQQAVLPYQPFVEALRHHLRHGRWTPDDALRPELRALAHLLPRVRQLLGAADHTPAGNQEIPRFALFDAMSSLLWRWAGERPLLLVLDDLHWADEPTLLLLRHLLRDPQDGALMVVTTSRDSAAGAGVIAGLLADRQDCGEEMTLCGLDEQATQAMVASRLGTASDAVVDALRARTDGVPFFLDEALQPLIGARTPVHAGDELERLLAATGAREHILARTVRRVEREAPLAGDVMRAGAVLASAGAEFDLRTVERMLDAPAGAVFDAAQVARSGGVLIDVPTRTEGFAFSHALVREAVYGSLPPGQRARLHLRAGDALEGLAEVAPGVVAAAEPAHHFWQVRRHEPQRAIRHLMRAGQQAARALAYEDAVGHYRRAVQVHEECGLPSEDRHCDLLLALGRAQWRAGQGSARESFRLAAASARRRRDPEQLARAALGLAERSWEAATGDESRGHLRCALELLGDGDSPLRSRLLALLGEHLQFTAKWREGAQASRDALEMAERLTAAQGDDDDPHAAGATQSALASALIGRHIALLDVHHADERRALIERALSLRQARRELRGKALHWYLFDLCEAGHIALAAEAHDELAQLAGQLHQPDFERVAVAWQGVLAQLRGDVPAAERLAAETYALSVQAGTYDADSTLNAQRFTLRRWQGRLAEEAGTYEKLSRGGIAPIVWRAATAVARLEDPAQRDRAREEYEWFAARGFDVVPRGFLWSAAMALLAELCRAFDDRSRAPDLYARLSGYADRHVQLGLATNWGSLERHLGLLAGTSGDRAAAEAHLRRAVDRNDALGAPVLAAEARCDLAGILEDRDPGQAADLVARVVDVAERHGAHRLVALARERAR